ncbi:DegV family protein [Oceanobacillus sp. APA_J-2(6-2)]|nr:DegV family protein [Oceanobacillus alkalisoli]MCF3944922.1 DegV family protein [Oceanobacillus alkalisoli]
MTSKIIFSTESGADLPKDLKLKYNIQVVPMHVIMDGKDYLDGTLPVQEIYDFYARNQKIPSTTSTNSHEYHDFFTNINNDFVKWKKYLKSCCATILVNTTWTGTNCI